MSKKFTRSWLLDWTEKPISEQDMRCPLDHDFLLAYRDGDAKTRAELETLVLEVLSEAKRQDLRYTTPWTHRVENLANLVDSMELRDAVPELLKLANLSFPLGEMARGPVLAALANLQEPLVLWDFWKARWGHWSPELEPAVFAGLLGSDPVRTLQMLPQILARSNWARWLGDGLWAMATHEDLPQGAFAKATQELLDEEKRLICRDALEKMGATPEELAAWVPLEIL